MPIFEDPDGDGLYAIAGLMDLGSGLYSASSNSTVVQWRDVVFAGPSETDEYFLRDIKGWEEMPPYETQKIPVGGGHGTLVAPVRFDERVVTVTGWCYNRTARDGLLAAFQRSLAPSVDGFTTEPLTISHASRVLSADARVVAFSALPEVGWALGRFAWAVQWLCNDPLRYGGRQTLTSYLPPPPTGLALPLSLPATFPDSPTGGRFPAVNDGTAMAPAIYTLTGPISNPGVLLNSGTEWQRLVQYSLVLGSGQTLTIDTARGGTLDGEYRPPFGTSVLARDLELRPGGNTVQALGSVVGSPDPMPYISCSFRPAYW